MAYFTPAKYRAKFGDDEALRLTDEDNSNTIDEGKISAVISSADAVIDSYIASRYTLPLASAPLVLESISAALSREELHTNFPTESVTLAADNARKMLRDIQAGKSELPVASGDTEPEQVAGKQVRFVGPDRVFSKSHLDMM